MSINGAMSHSLSGLYAAVKRMDVVSANIANSATPGYHPLRVNSSTSANGDVETSVSQETAASDGLSSSDLLDMIGARADFSANLAAFETGASFWDMTLAIKRD